MKLEPPVIGITTYLEQARWGPWDLPAAVLPAAYAEAVARVGGMPVLLPPVGAAPQLPFLDGLVISGGADLDPASYGCAPDPKTQGTRPDRDRFELELLRWWLSVGAPVLGICRGMQMLNVASGGTLEQHLPRSLGSERHRGIPGAFSLHSVRFDPRSVVESVHGHRAEVLSYHHQGVDQLGSGLRVTGWADDNTIEAIELAGHEFAVGVLWHPEADADDRLFTVLVERAAAFRDRRSSSLSADSSGAGVV